jgi:serine/threonine protein kinase
MPDYSFLGRRNMYLVMEFLPGGDLFSLLQKCGSIDEAPARVYTAQILSALRYLHSNGIIHRDLKPDNILVAADGRLKLTDFGLSYMGVVDRGLQTDPSDALVEANSIVGTPDYLAPEIVLSQRHTYTADYWSLGTVLYEFLYGIPPFHADTPDDIFRRIVTGVIIFPATETISEAAQDLIRKLLTANPAQRLGAGGIEEIMRHPWFAEIDWDHVDELEPPFIPETDDETSTDYFEERYDFEDGGEDDIRADVADAVGDAVGYQPPSPTDGGGICGSIGTILRHEFPSVALKQLRQINENLALRMRKRGRPSLDSPPVPPFPPPLPRPTASDGP